MARQTLEQRLAAERDKIEASRQWREDQGYVDRWRRMIDLYRGKQVENNGEEPYDQAMVNLAFSIQNTVVASVTTQYPKFTVSPNVIGQDAQATIAEAVLNYCWRHYDFHPEFQASVNDMCMMGHGWLKVGWRYREEQETVTLSPDEQMAQVAEITAQADAMAGQVPPEQAGEMPTDEEIADAVKPTQKVTNVLEDDPFVERVSPFDMVIDPEACTYRELRWIAQRTIRDLEAVQNDTSYSSTARHKVQADMSVAARDDTYNPSRHDAAFQNEDDERVTVWEFYNLTDSEWCVFAENGEGFLVKPTKTPTPFANPFLMFRDYDVPDSFYPIGEIESIETLQEELNKTRTQQIHSRKQFVRKFIAREAALSTRAREALASEVDGDVAFVTDDDRPLSDVIIPAPSLSFDPNLFNNHSQQIIQDLQMVTGLSDYQFGQMPDTRRLATEAMAVEGQTNARSSFKLSKIERGLADVGRYLLQVLQTFMDAQRVARVAGPGGEMLFEFGPDDIGGEFDFMVEAGSTQPKNDMIRRQEAVTLFNTLAPFMGSLIEPHALITYLLSQGYDIKNVDRFFVPPPPPMPVGPDGQPMQPGLGGPPQPGGPPMEPGVQGAGPPAPGLPAQGNGAPPATQPPIPAGV